MLAEAGIAVEAEAFQKDYSETKAKVGIDTAKLFEDPKLIKASERSKLKKHTLEPIKF